MTMTTERKLSSGPANDWTPSTMTDEAYLAAVKQAYGRRKVGYTCEELDEIHDGHDRGLTPEQTAEILRDLGLDRYPH